MMPGPGETIINREAERQLRPRFVNVARAIDEMHRSFEMGGPSMDRLRSSSDEAADRLRTVALASMHAAVGLGQIIRQGGGAGGIFGGLLSLAGGIVGAVHPLAGAAMMAGGSLISGLSAPDNKPTPVSVERYGTRAMSQRAGEDTMIHQTFILELPSGETKHIYRTIRRMQLRDGVQRLAF
jgi:hypothetical protein